MISFSFIIKFLRDLGPTNDGKVSPQRQPPSYIGSPANEQEVCIYIYIEFEIDCISML
jgi:hypothetical protein